MRRALLLLLLLAAPCWSQKVELPAEVKAEPGTFAVVTATTDCKTLQWVSLDQGLSLIPPELLRDSKAAVVMAGRSGRYRLLAYGALGDAPSRPAITTVVVGEVPPGPGPGPGPTPPPVPDGKYGILRISHDRASEVDRALLPVDVPRLAAAQRSVASGIDAGAYVTAAAILDAWRSANRTALPSTQTAWLPWGTAVGSRIKTLNESGNLTTPATWAEMFREVADGLEAALPKKGGR